MKTILLTCIAVLAGWTAFGQTVIVVSPLEGKMADTVRISGYKKRDLIFSGIVNEAGKYVIPVESFVERNKLTVRVEARGFESLVFEAGNNEKRQVLLTPIGAGLDEVVVTGQLSSRSADQSVQKIRIIDKAVIEAKGAVNLKDVLQSELNIRLSQDQVLGTGMSLQGLSGQNVKILIDGVPVIGRVDGEIDLSQINLAMIERIEIVEGPSSVSFGSNALAGTVNLITKKKKGPGKQVQAASYYETAGNYNLDLNASATISKTALQVYGQRNYFDGWHSTEPFAELPKSKIADSGRYQSWKPKLQYQAGLKWTVPLKNVTITPFFDYFWEQIHNKGLPRAPYFMSAFDDYYTTNRTNQGAQLDAKIGKYCRVQGVGAYNYYQRIKNTYLKNLNTLEQQLTILPGDQDTSVFTAAMSRLSFIRNKADGWFNYEIGYDVNQESAEGRRILDQSQTITEAALFTNTEFHWKRLIVKPGLRATYNSAYRESITPALNLKYATDKWNYRVGIASGFRSPSIKELYMDFVDINHNIQGNTELAPEQSMHYQTWIGTKRTIRKLPLSIDVNGYYQHVNDRITLAQDATNATQYSYFNLDEFESIGLQSTIDIAPGKHHLRVGAAYIGTKSNLTVNGYAFSPELTAAVSVFWKKPGITVASFYKYTGKVTIYTQSVEALTDVSFISDYHMLDVSAMRKWKFLIITIGAKNLLNVRQITVSTNSQGAHSSNATSTPIGWGTSAYVKLQFNLRSKL